MSTAGPNNPGTIAEVDNAAGTKSWTTITNAGASDNAYATNAPTAGASGVTEYMHCTNFGFTIPATATINGITVEIERKASLNNTSFCVDQTLRLIKGGTAGGTDKKDTVTKYPTADAYATYGSGSDLWGNTLTAADVNASNFGVQFAVTMTKGVKTASPSVSVDHVRVTITYTVKGIAYGIIL